MSNRTKYWAQHSSDGGGSRNYGADVVRCWSRTVVDVHGGILSVVKPREFASGAGRVLSVWR